MNKLNFKLVFAGIIVIFIIAVTGNAFAESAPAYDFSSSPISLKLSNESIRLEQGKSLGVKMTFESSSKELKCANIQVFSNSNNITATSAMNRICLNKGQKSLTTVNIYAKEFANEGTYKATVELEIEGKRYRKEISVEVDNENRIKLIQIESRINANKSRDYLVFKVRNKTDENRSVELQAVSNMFMPYFEPSQLYLESDEIREVKLFVNSNPTMEMGRYSLDVIVESKNVNADANSDYDTYSKQEILFEITKEIPVIELLSGIDCKTLNKEENERITFTVKNLSDELQEVRLVSTGDLPNNLGVNSIALQPYEIRNIALNVEARNTDESGEHKITVYAYNNFFSVSKEICVYVNPIRDVDIEFSAMDFDLETGEEETFYILAENNGDVTEYLEVELPSNTGLEFSKGNFDSELESRESAIIPITVKAGSTAFGDYSELIRVRVVDNFLYQELVNVNVTSLNAVEVISYPTELAINAGKDEEINIALLNNREVTLPATITIEGLPEGLDYEVARSTLLPDTAQEVSIKLLVSEELEFLEANAEIVVKGENFETRKALKIVQEGADPDLFTGLVGLFTLGNMPLLGLVVILLIVLGYLIYNREEVGKTVYTYFSKKEETLTYRQ